MKNISFKTAKNDIIAGIIVALVSIPISMGYAQIAGLPAAYGLYGSLIPVLIYAFTTTSRHGAIVSDNIDMDIVFREKLENELELLLAEAAINGMDKNDFLSMCNEIYSKMKVSGDSEPKTT